MLKLLIATICCIPGLSLKVKVDGDGYMRFIRDGRAVYAKQATLSVDEGKLCDSAGDSLLPAVAIGADATAIEVDLQGSVYAVYKGSKMKAGRIVLAQFSPSASLQPRDVVLISDERPHLGDPGDDTFGVIRTAPGETSSPVVTNTATEHMQVVLPDSISKRIAQIDAKTPKKEPVKTTVAGAAVQRGIQITVEDKAIIASDHITVGDIAQIDGDPALVAQVAKVELGDTPTTGGQRTVDRDRILTKLRAAGFRPEDMTVIVPAPCEVRRKGQMIPKQQFAVVAIQALINKNVPEGAWNSTDTYDDLEVPSGKIELKAESVLGGESGDATVTVAIYVNGQRYNARTVHLHLQQKYPPINPGAAVKVIMIAGHASVEVPGIAKTGGRLGETIEVEVQVGSPSIKTTHTAVITGPGVVEVRL